MRKRLSFATGAVVVAGLAAGVFFSAAASDLIPASVPDVPDGGAEDIGPTPSRGIVRSWDIEGMQGVIDGDDIPGGCHILFAAVAIDGFPALSTGQQVEFEWYRDEQSESGFPYECSRAWPAGEQPYDEPEAFSSRAWTVRADGTVEEITETDLAEPVPTLPRVTGQAMGTVQMWNDEEGWGVIDSAQTPGGCWAFYSEIVGDGFRSLVVGATVTLDWEQLADQDGYRYRATRVEQHGG
ncbi:cold-shock protein [Rhodococcus sp. NPDC057014]|uniref:cold-shock protein n=1 Tax=unclassified Rhodococcus (in: high G+C Gram-positive bacteria) TaxID=192944 RepID=UPI00363D9CE5